MKEKSVLVLFTCFNRMKKTIKAVKDLSNQYNNIFFLIVDDNSSDDTVKQILNLKRKNIHVIETEGNCYYTSSMRIGMEYLISNHKKYNYLLIINDDVEFSDNFLKKMVLYSEKNNCVCVGATIDSNGLLSYGGIIYKSHGSFERVGPDFNNECDTFNGNCVLIPYNAFLKVGPMDKHYTHSIGDFDYGLSMKRNGFHIYMFDEYVGHCDRNNKKNTWEDNKLPIKERIRKKEHPKGFPTKENFYYFYKNFNIFLAIRKTITPYLKILLKK